MTLDESLHSSHPVSHAGCCAIEGLACHAWREQQCARPYVPLRSPSTRCRWHVFESWEQMDANKPASDSKSWWSNDEKALASSACICIALCAFAVVEKSWPRL
eukprot:scaffold264106_cov32-Tisochrysis_lutea.AAC.1